MGLAARRAFSAAIRRNLSKRMIPFAVVYTAIAQFLRVGVPNATDNLRAYPWDLCDIWLATSKGFLDLEHGQSRPRRSPRGS